MKSRLLTFLAAAAVLVFANSAKAQTDVYITGSTAYRSAVLTQLTTVGNVFSAITSTAWDSSSSSVTGATYVNITGTLGGNSVRVKCSFSGSAGGVYQVANNGAGTPPKTYYLNDSASGSGYATPSATSSPVGDLAVADIAFSDVFQTSTPFATPRISHDTQVGVVPFKWVGNYSLAQNSAGGTVISNMTSQATRGLFGGATIISAATLTGNHSDEPIFIFAFGRDFDSGTRITTYAESGNGVLTTPNHWQAYVSPTTNAFVGQPGGASQVATDTQIAQIQLWNQGNSYTLYNNTLTVAGTPSAYPSTIGSSNGGYNSGGSLAKLMRLDSNTNVPSYYNTNLAANVGYGGTTCTGAYIITSLGLSDSVTALAAPGGGAFGMGAAKELSFNGVFYSTSAVQEGQYTFWSYEHMLYNTLTGAKLTTATNLASAIKSNTDTTQGGAGILLGNMLVARSVDGATVLAGYY